MSQDFIPLLRQQLKDFSPAEQEALIEEISSHIESGEEDPRMGKNQEERKARLMTELGSPREMSNGFRGIYRNGRLIDYLLVAIPYLLYPFLNMLYVSLMPRYSWADVRLDILLHLPLVVIGLWRRSAPLALFWISTLVTQIVTMLLLVQGYYGVFQTMLWLLVALGLLLVLGWIVWQNRHDQLIVAFGLVPIVMCAVGSLLAIIHPSASASYRIGPVDRLLLDIYINAAGSGGYLLFYGMLITWALFFLAMNRNVRWLALGLYGLVIALSRDYLNLFDADRGLMHPWTYSFYVLVPLVIVLLGWWLSHARVQPPIAG